MKPTKWGWAAIPKKPKTKQNTLVKKLDAIFSKYIRTRDTIKGYGRCVTCNRLITYENCDCGHFISRNKHSVRWDEHNANGQCKQCNRFLAGKQYEHGIAIDKKFGAGTAESLLNWSKMEVRTDHAEKIEYFKQKLKSLANPELG